MVLVEITQQVQFLLSNFAIKIEAKAFKLRLSSTWAPPFLLAYALINFPIVISSCTGT